MQETEYRSLHQAAFHAITMRRPTRRITIGRRAPSGQTSLTSWKRPTRRSTMTEISRRALLTGATATAATVGLISPGPISAKPLEAVADPEADAKGQFIKLSEALTGFDHNLLVPNVDPFRFSDEVFARAKDADSVRFQ